MKLESLRYYREQFKKKLASEEPYSQAYKWECQEIFQREWDLEELDLGTMYNRALSHPVSGNLWGGNYQSAKSVMLEFILVNREFVRSMFRDLLATQKDLSMRIERFHFHCDQLLEQLRSGNRRINHHLHEGYYMPTLYLTLRYPENHCIYDPEHFGRSLLILDARNPQDTSLSRFNKVIPILQSQLLQDPDLLRVMKEKITLTNHHLYQSLWLAYEFYQFIANQKS